MRQHGVCCATSGASAHLGSEQQGGPMRLEVDRAQGAPRLQHHHRLRALLAVLPHIHLRTHRHSDTPPLLPEAVKANPSENAAGTLGCLEPAS